MAVAAASNHPHDQVSDLIAGAAAADGFSALNEAALLELRRGGSGVVRLPVRENAALVGYGQLDTTTDPASASLVVAPADRRRGIGAALLSDLVTAADGRLTVWAPRNTPAAVALATRAGLRPVRELLVLRRGLDDNDAVPVQTPEALVIRPFVPGRDEAAWLAVNSRAFASHPEQGRIGPAGLAERMDEDWFDPEGFLLAERDDELVGFHWTKQHPGKRGEVYVLGVDPGAARGGIGLALLGAGLAVLRVRGNDEVILYVEADNAPARGLYNRAGFGPDHSDVLYSTV